MSEDSHVYSPDQIGATKEEQEQLTKLHALKYGYIEYQIKGLEGDILTIIDASVPDREQRKAQKDLVKQMFRKKINWICELCYPDMGRGKISSQ